MRDGNKFVKSKQKPNFEKENRPQNQMRGNNNKERLASKENKCEIRNKTNEKNKSSMQNKSNGTGILHVNEASNPNSCVIYIGKHRCRALIDTGADMYNE